MSQTDKSEDNVTVSDIEKIQSAVETANPEDEKDQESTDDTEDIKDTDEESQEDQTDSSDTEDESDDEESDDDDSEENEKEDQTEERKFKNLAAKDDTKYIQNLEKAYENSSAEAIRLNTELKQSLQRVDAILKAVGSDEKLADGLNDAIQSDDGHRESEEEDPFLVHSKNEWETRSRKEVQDIIDANPELISDTKLSDQVKHWMGVFSNAEFNQNKRMMTGGEAMKAAMAYLNVEDKRVKENIASKSKDVVAPSKPRTSRKPKKASRKVSDSAYKFGEFMGVSREKVEKYVK